MAQNQSTTSTQISTQVPDDKSLLQAVLKTDDVPTLNVATSSIKENVPSKEQITDLKESRKTPEDVSFKPASQTPTMLAMKYEICTPMLRYPLTLKRLQKVSTYIPVSINYFQIVHFMDELISTNVYFLRLGIPWHPLLSRLYFAELFFIQTLRAMRYAKIGSSTTRLFIEQLLKDYPPESLPIPGPLLPVLQSISVCTSDDPLYGSISPSISNDVGYNPASDLLDIGDESFVLPNIPAIASFLNTIIHAEGDIPDYSDINTFDDSEDRNLQGHDFPANDWQITERLVLLSPGLNCQIESNPEIDENMHMRGQELDIPVIDPDDDLTGIERYMLMSNNSTWFHNVVDVMAIYCSFFKESTTLAACSPHGPTCGLLRSRLTTLTSQNAQNNIVNTLTHAFPAQYPFLLRYDHRSYELNMAQNYQLIGQLSAVNTSTNYRGLNAWGNFNNPGTGREGPYWNQNPSLTQSLNEENLDEVESLIGIHYFKEQP